MANTDFEEGIFVVPKNGYKVSESTAAVVDCIRMFDAFYSRVAHALEIMYGDTGGERRLNNVYFPQWSVIQDLLYKDLNESIKDKLVSLSNIQDEDEILL